MSRPGRKFYATRAPDRRRAALSRQREDAIDAVSDGDAPLFRLDVNVTRPRRDAGARSFVDERADGRTRVLAAARRRARPVLPVRCCTSTSASGCSRATTSPRYTSSMRAAMSSAAAIAKRICRPVANPSVRSQSMLSGSAVATSSSCSVADRGTTWKRLAILPGTSETACDVAQLDRRSIGRRNLVASVPVSASGGAGMGDA